MSNENLVSQGALQDSCCGGPAPQGTEACCVADEEAKAEGQEGCGCNSTQLSEVKASSSSCCG